MSLLVYPSFGTHPYFRHSWWDSTLDTPSRIFDQHFGFGLCEDDLYPAQRSRGLYVRPRRALIRQKSGMSEVVNDDKKFQASLEVGSFTPEELTVKTIDNCVVIHGKHEEKSDDYGFISREFTRKYMLPAETQPEDVICEFVDGGRLVITAPKKPKELPEPKERDVNIVQPTTPKL